MSLIETFYFNFLKKINNIFNYKFFYRLNWDSVASNVEVGWKREWVRESERESEWETVSKEI